MSNISIDEWLDMMSDTVTITPWTSQSGSGVPTYGGTAYTITCRIEMKNHLIIDNQGREIMARGRIIMATTTIPSILDQITLPSDYVPTNPPILAVNVEPDDISSHHVTLEIG